MTGNSGLGEFLFKDLRKRTRSFNKHVVGFTRPGAPQITREAGRKGSAIGAQSMRKLAQDAYTDLIPTLRDMRANGLSLRAIAARLDAEGHTTRRGRSWTPTQVSRVIARCSARKLG